MKAFGALNWGLSSFLFTCVICRHRVPDAVPSFFHALLVLYFSCYSFSLKCHQHAFHSPNYKPPSNCKGLANCALVSESAPKIEYEMLVTPSPSILPITPSPSILPITPSPLILPIVHAPRQIMYFS